MHIGLVAQGDPDSALDLANALHELGMCTTLYLSHAHITREIGTHDQPIERLYGLGLVPPECSVRLFRFPRRRDPRSFGMIRRLARTMRDDGVNVAHIIAGPDELWLAGLCCLLRGLPVTATMVVPKPNVGDLPVLTWASNKLLAFASEVIIVNGANQVSLVERLYGTPSSRIAYVPLGARTTSVRWRHQTQPEEPFTVLFFGRADPHKGLEHLVQAEPLITQRVPQARIVIVGHGQDLERCRQMIHDSSKIEIHEGYVSGDTMAAFFERASLVALPYLSASTSAVLLTAYAFAKPVVATSVGCLPEYVQHGVTGLLVPPSDVEQLASGIVRLLSDSSQRHRMGENAKRWAEQQRMEITRQTRSVYEEAIRVHQNAKN